MFCFHSFSAFIVAGIRRNIQCLVFVAIRGLGWSTVGWEALLFWVYFSFLQIFYSPYTITSFIPQKKPCLFVQNFFLEGLWLKSFWFEPSFAANSWFLQKWQKGNYNCWCWCCQVEEYHGISLQVISKWAKFVFAYASVCQWLLVKFIIACPWTKLYVFSISCYLMIFISFHISMLCLMELTQPVISMVSISVFL